MPVRRTLDQERASAAWTAVQAVTQRDASLQGDYRALTRGFAATIQLNGLGTACAFLFAKAGPGASDARRTSAHGLLLDHIQSWVRQRLPMNEQQSLMEWLTAANTSSDEYRRATVEVLAYLLWLRRFAEGALTTPERSGSENP